MNKDLSNKNHTDAIEAKEWVRERWYTSPTPFRDRHLVQRLVVGAVLTSISFIERILGTKLYIHHRLGSLIAVHNSALILLKRLRTDGLVGNWELHHAAPHTPPIVYCRLHQGNYTLPDGSPAHFHGSNALGFGLQENEAIIPALAEALERHAAVVWDSTRLHTAPYMEGKEMLSPQGFLAPKDSFAENQPWQWIVSRSLQNSKKVYIPAQLAHFTLHKNYPDEPRLQNITTSGTAAAISYEKASVGAINELIERDAFITAWLLTKVPVQIAMETITDANCVSLYTEFIRLGFTLKILDITSDSQVPTLCAVLLSSPANSVVTVVTATDFDPLRALKKVLLELAFWLQLPTLTTDLKTSTEITTFADRRRYWSEADAADKIQWFLEGPQRALAELHTHVSVSTYPTVASQLQYYRDWFLSQKFDCYLVDITSKKAQSAGLAVVKAITADLVPIYFKETNKPVHHRRLQREGACATLNPTPHPFI
jgi:thiazole/oxazole-forming peptide maturase SagD family component